jgi:hypothetical protein
VPGTLVRRIGNFATKAILASDPNRVSDSVPADLFRHAAHFGSEGTIRSRRPMALPMDNTPFLILIIVILLLFLGGGWYGRGRWY